MDLRFAQTIEEANEQFIVVFGPSHRLVSLALRDKEFELYQKAQYARKQRFYREYADRELSRIVVSLLKE